MEQLSLDLFSKNDLPALNPAWMESNGHSFSFIDLFAGIGGMRIGFESAGGHCVFSSEIDPDARKTYQANFGEEPFGDITSISPEDIPDHDVLVGGFPCQPFSIAGVSKKRSLNRPTGFQDETQGTLFFNICEILKAKRPKAFCLENVRNLVSHDKKRTFQIILKSLEELDYEVSYKIIDGRAYVPQHRERIFLIGFDRKRYGILPGFSFNLTPPLCPPRLRDILEVDADPKYTLSDRLWQYLQEYKIRQQAKGNGFGYSIADPKGVTRTLSARYYKDGSEILIAQKGQNPRKLTPRECARLQGFDDSFRIPVSDGKAYHQFGNSVVVPLVKNLARLIASELEYLDQEEKKAQPVL